ncbi:MAG: DNA-binding response regulator [Bacteroidota bacterium]
MKVLIVEDEILIAQTIKLYLMERGHATQGFCISYEEFVAAYEKEVPDLVLLDIRLYGERSGLEIAKYLNASPESVPFVYLTSQQDKRTFDLALATTPHGYLPKPIRKETLWTTIETAYQLSQSNVTPAVNLFDGKSTHQIIPEDLLYVQSEHVYTNVFLKGGGKVVIRKPLSWFLESFKSLERAHRSYLVNPDMVRSWDSDVLTLRDGTKIPLSRSYKKMFQERLRGEN